MYKKDTLTLKTNHINKSSLKSLIINIYKYLFIMNHLFEFIPFLLYISRALICLHSKFQIKFFGGIAVPKTTTVEPLKQACPKSYI